MPGHSCAARACGAGVDDGPGAQVVFDNCPPSGALSIPAASLDGDEASWVGPAHEAPCDGGSARQIRRTAGS